MSSRRALSLLLASRSRWTAAGEKKRRSIESTSTSSSSFSTSTSSTSSTSPETAFAVATCGNGDHGRLGHGDLSSSTYFRIVTGGGLDPFSASNSSSSSSTSPTSSSRPVAVAAGGAHTLVLTSDGAVLSFGLNDAGQLGHSEGASFVTIPMEALIPEEAVAIAAGDRHSLAVGASGRVWAWGAGGGAGAAPGEDGGLMAPARMPRLVPGISAASSVAAGSAHSLILCREDGSDGKGVVFSWGDGSRGALGHGEGSASATGSGFFSFFSFGRNKRRRGRAAAERAAPRLLRTLSSVNIESISASGSRSGAVENGAAGETFIWGDDGGFRAAVSGKGRRELDLPARVHGLPCGVGLLALGRSHALAVRHGGEPLLSWGDGGDHGVLGVAVGSSRGDDEGVDLPRRVAFFDGRNVVSASAGWKHSLACCDVPSLSCSPSLFSWGWGGSQGSEGPLDPRAFGTGGGQLGLGAEGGELDRATPAAVTELLHVVAGASSSSSPSRNCDRLLRRWKAHSVSAGLNHSAALVEVL